MFSLDTGSLLPMSLSGARLLYPLSSDVLNISGHSLHTLSSILALFFNPFSVNDHSISL